MPSTAEVMTFEGTGPVPPPYVEDGVQLTASQPLVHPTGYFVTSSSSSLIELVPVTSNGSFGLTSIDLDGFLNARNADGDYVTASGNVTFVISAQKTDDSSITDSPWITTDASAGFQTFILPEFYQSGLKYFSIRVIDPANDTNPFFAFDNITLTPPNSAPVAQSGTFNVDVKPADESDLNSPAAVFSGHLSATDSDTPQANLTYSNTSPLPAGFHLNADGSFTYDPSQADLDLLPGETRSFDVSFRVNDGEFNSNTATAHIVVTGYTPTTPGVVLVAGKLQHPNGLNGTAGNDIINSKQNNDVINGGWGDDRLIGYNDRDLLNGGYGRDYLEGGNGNDTLNGGAGSDTLVGGHGKDVFVFDSGTGEDQVLDFDYKQDRIDLGDIAFYRVEASASNPQNVAIIYIDDQNAEHTITLVNVNLASFLKADPFV
jgi:Ca2+-binding RTX toxin-like protein